MNRSDKHDEDILRQYIDTERIEKAPDDFTHRVMTMVRLEHNPLKGTKKLMTKSIVPAISVIITLTLIIMAFILSGDSPESLNISRFIQNIDFPVLKINFESLMNFNLPVWIPFLFVGIFLMAILDRILVGLFHRGRR